MEPESAIDTVLGFLTFGDMLSDALLLTVLWPQTRAQPPELVSDSCSLDHFISRLAYWWVALGLLITSTMIVAVPEVIYLACVAFQPAILLNSSWRWRVLKLAFTDGKAIVAFAASEHDVPGELEKVRLAVRGCLARIYRVVTVSGTQRASAPLCYSGIVAILLTGEVMATIAALIFLAVEFNWVVLVSLVFSFLTLVVSGQKSMKSASLSADRSLDDYAYGSLIPLDYLGVLRLAYVLAVPVLPTFLSLCGVTFDHSGDTVVYWANPVDWVSENSLRLSKWESYHFLMVVITTPSILAVLALVRQAVTCPPREACPESCNDLPVSTPVSRWGDWSVTLSGNVKHFSIWHLVVASIGLGHVFVVGAWLYSSARNRRRRAFAGLALLYLLAFTVVATSCVTLGSTFLASTNAWLTALTLAGWASEQSSSQASAVVSNIV